MNRIPLDPKLPKNFHDTPNNARSKTHLDQWWDRPYGVTVTDGRIEVRCLNGGAWDRPTHFGVAEDYNAACALAEATQADWLKFRRKPSPRASLPQTINITNSANRLAETRNRPPQQTSFRH